MNETGTNIRQPEPQAETPPELRSGRVHELTGPGAPAFAFLMARKGPVLLCGAPRWVNAYHPEAAARFCDPDAVLHVSCPLEIDVLWTAETALRSGAMRTVIAGLEKSPGLTNFRRLQLAAQTGRSLGVLIVNRPSHSSAAETRWHVTPAPSDCWETFRLHASLYKNKRGFIGGWVLNVSGEKDTLRLDAAPAGEPVRPDRIAG